MSITADKTSPVILTAGLILNKSSSKPKRNKVAKPGINDQVTEDPKPNKPNKKPMKIPSPPSLDIPFPCSFRCFAALSYKPNILDNLIITGICKNTNKQLQRQTMIHDAFIFEKTAESFLYASPVQSVMERASDEIPEFDNRILCPARSF